MSLLEVRNLEAWYGSTQALFGLNFALEAGGNLRTTLVVEAESSTGQISPGRGGGLVGLAAVLGGPPGEAAALTIESGVLRLGGALLTNERLIR